MGPEPLSSAASLMFLCSAGCLRGLTIFRLLFPGSQISWLPAGFIQWDALDGDGRERGKEKPCFSLSPSLSWVVSTVAAACLPGLQILLGSCAVVPTSVWWLWLLSSDNFTSSFAPAA